MMNNLFPNVGRRMLIEALEQQEAPAASTEVAKAPERGFVPSPDEQRRIDEALALLLEAERPKVAIRVMDPDPKQFLIFKYRPNTEAIAHREGTNQTLYLNRRSPSFVGADPRLLASKLAHEGRHFDDPNDVVDEVAGYQREFDVLSRLGYDQKYLRALKAHIDSLSKSR